MGFSPSSGRARQRYGRGPWPHRRLSEIRGLDASSVLPNRRNRPFHSRDVGQTRSTVLFQSVPFILYRLYGAS